MSSETKQEHTPIEPRTDLGKLLLAIVQSVGSSDPPAFLAVNVANAIKQADETIGEICP